MHEPKFAEAAMAIHFSDEVKDSQKVAFSLSVS